MNSPLFNKDLDTLKKKLRLQSAVNEGTLSVLDDAILQVRLEMYRELGTVRVQEIQGTPLVDNPTTDDQRLRATAALCESLWVRCFVLRRLSVLVAESSNDAEAIWNQEGITREIDFSTVDRECDELMRQVYTLLGDLYSGDAEDFGGVQADCIGPDDTNSYPGSSVFI